VVDSDSDSALVVALVRPREEKAAHEPRDRKRRSAKSDEAAARSAASEGGLRSRRGVGQDIGKEVGREVRGAPPTPARARYVLLPGRVEVVTKDGSFGVLSRLTLFAGKR
jgi:hypothetical protein